MEKVIFQDFEMASDPNYVWLDENKVRDGHTLLLFSPLPPSVESRYCSVMQVKNMGRVNCSFLTMLWIRTGVIQIKTKNGKPLSHAVLLQSRYCRVQIHIISNVACFGTWAELELCSSGFLVLLGCWSRFQLRWESGLCAGPSSSSLWWCTRLPRCDCGQRLPWRWVCLCCCKNRWKWLLSSSPWCLRWVTILWR